MSFVAVQTTSAQILPARVIGSDSPIVLPADLTDWDQRFRDVQQWMTDYAAWKVWDDRWRGKREPGLLGFRARRSKPDPPAWLSGECRDLIDGEGVLADACAMLADWKDDYSTALLRQQMAAARVQDETPTNSRWWEHVHFDLLWPMTQFRSNVYGVVGMHATMEVTGRLQVFVAPGAMLLNLPTRGGKREWKPATDWGFSIRMFDFQLPGWDQRASLHMNMAKAWVLSGQQNLVNTSIDLAGFSVTFKKTAPPPTP